MNTKTNRSSELELEVMAHRYLYYVVCNPVLSDKDYDELELEARRVCTPDSSVHKLGSSLASSYTENQIIKANCLYKP